MLFATLYHDVQLYKKILLILEAMLEKRSTMIDLIRSRMVGKWNVNIIDIKSKFEQYTFSWTCSGKMDYIYCKWSTKYCRYAP